MSWRMSIDDELRYLSAKVNEKFKELESKIYDLETMVDELEARLNDIEEGRG